MCGARRRAAGLCLGSPVLGGSGRCRMHNGAAVSGPDHPGWVHGRRSRLAPPDLGRLISEALGDPSLVALEEDLATIEAVIGEELKECGNLTPADLWREAVALYDAAGRASKNCPVVEVGAAAWSSLRSVLQNGLGERVRRDRLVALSEARARVAAVEHRRRAFLERHVDAQTLRAFFDSLLADVMELVGDPQARAELGRRIAARVGSLPEPGPLPSDA
ncbi:MAG: hypothetical protein KF884_10730 [Fimbriimonadaceae bacterium]|nr:MAG: hypothetical protein KF884_10730 [Fimbriimonadaceae bacterium]